LDNSNRSGVVTGGAFEAALPGSVIRGAPEKSADRQGKESGGSFHEEKSKDVRVTRCGEKSKKDKRKWVPKKKPWNKNLGGARKVSASNRMRWKQVRRWGDGNL